MGKTPDMLKHKVVLLPGLDEYVEAFMLLSSSRPVYMNGVEGVIPFSELAAYCNLMGVTDVEDFVHVIKSMDFSYLNARLKTDGNRRN